MKKLVLISAITMSGLFYNTANAQIRLRFGINFGPRPVVVQSAPVAYCEPANYNGDEDYYYLPDVDAYYSVNEQCYYYMDGDQWISAAYLPGAYRDFDWRSVRRFEVRAPRPFMHNDYYRARYNGVAFNGRWDVRNDYRGGFADNHDRDYRRFDNHDRYRRDDDRFVNQYRRDDHRFDNRSDHDRFAQNMPRQDRRDDRDYHRPRF